MVEYSCLQFGKEKVLIPVSEHQPTRLANVIRGQTSNFSLNLNWHYISYWMINSLFHHTTATFVCPKLIIP